MTKKIAKDYRAGKIGINYTYKCTNPECHQFIGYLKCHEEKTCKVCGTRHLRHGRNGGNDGLILVNREVSNENKAD